MAKEVTHDVLNQWATDDTGPVALHLKQKLLPVEAVNGECGVIFPPTYADIGYNIDTLSDGTRVATIDSVGSQANRLEPIFNASSQNRDEWLVPQIEIVLRSEPCGECEACKKAQGEKKNRNSNGCTNPRKVTRSIFDLAHRAADAVVQSSPKLNDLVQKAFRSLQEGDAGPLCELAPTSLVFGVWDSRGGSGEKRPRLVRSIIRAWDVELLHAAAQFNSVWKALNEEQKAELEKEAKKQKVKLSVKGFADAPGIFRRDTKAPQYHDGVPNPEARVLGGVFAKGRIEREVTVNLVALRGIRGKNGDETPTIRKYLLGLSLMAATADIEMFLREGCHLRYAGEDIWHAVPRRGAPEAVQFPTTSDFLRQYTVKAANPFRSKWPKETLYTFDLSEAKKLLAKKTEEEEAGGGA
jgi:CRISPR-associated protein Csb1